MATQTMVLVDASLAKRFASLENKIDKLLVIQAATVPEESVFDFMTAEKTAELLGLKKSTLYGMTCRKEIPFRKQGKRLLFSRKDLAAFITNKK